MPDDINTSTVTIRRADGSTYTQTTVKGPSGTKIYNTEGGTTYLAAQNTSSGSRLRYVAPASSDIDTSTSSGAGSTASAASSTTVEKVPVYAKLNPDGTISEEIYTAESGVSKDIFMKSESTFVDNEGRTVVQSALLPTDVKQRIEAGRPYAITEAATNTPTPVYSGGATVQTGVIKSTTGTNTPTPRGWGNALDTFFLSTLKAGTTVNPVLAWGLKDVQLTSPLTNRTFTVGTPIRANVANKPIRSVLEFGANRPFETAGIAAATIWGAPYAATAIKGTAAYQGLAAFEGTTVGASLLGIGKTVGTSLLVTEAGKAIIPIFDVDYQKKLLNTNVNQADVNAARAAARQAERVSIQNQAWYKNIANEINPLLAGDTKTYRQTLTEQLQARGYEGRELQEAVNFGLKQRNYGGYAEIAGTVAANVGSELLGRKLISVGGIKVAENTFAKNFAKIGWRIGIAGVSEGVAIRSVQTRTRAETTSAGQLALYGGFGALSAGVIGGAIGAFGIKPAIQSTTGTAVKGAGASKLAKNLLLFGAYTTDPYEYAGDLIATGYEKAAGRAFSRQINVPLVSIIPSIVNTPAQTTTGRGKTNTLIPPLSIAVNTKVNTNTNIPTDISEDTNTLTPTDIFSFVDVNTAVNVNTNTQTNANTNIPTNVNVPAAINIPALTTAVTVAVPNARIPPILPLAFPSSLGTGGRGGLNRRKYINELAVGGALLQDLTGGNLSFTNTKPFVTVKKKSSKKSKSRSKRK